MFLQTTVFHVFLSTFFTLEFAHDVLLLDVPPESRRLVVLLAADRTHGAAAASTLVRPELSKPP